MLWAYIQSFWFPSYHRFSHIRTWKTALFALWILLVGVLIFNIYFILQLRAQLPVFLASLPTVTFSQGQMTAPQNRVSVDVPKMDYQIVFDATADTPPDYQTFLDNKIMMFVSKNHFSVPSVSGVQTQPIPTEWNLELTPQWLKENTKDIASVLQTIFFFASFFVFASFLLGSFS